MERWWLYSYLSRLAFHPICNTNLIELKLLAMHVYLYLVTMHCIVFRIIIIQFVLYISMYYVMVHKLTGIFQNSSYAVHYVVFYNFTWLYYKWGMIRREWSCFATKMTIIQISKQCQLEWNIVNNKDGTYSHVQITENVI